MSREKITVVEQQDINNDVSLLLTQPMGEDEEIQETLIRATLAAFIAKLHENGVITSSDSANIVKSIALNETNDGIIVELWDESTEELKIDKSVTGISCNEQGYLVIEYDNGTTFETQLPAVVVLPIGEEGADVTLNLQELAEYFYSDKEKYENISQIELKNSGTIRIVYNDGTVENRDITIKARIDDNEFVLSNLLKTLFNLNHFGDDELPTTNEFYGVLYNGEDIGYALTKTNAPFNTLKGKFEYFLALLFRVAQKLHDKIENSKVVVGNDGKSYKVELVVRNGKPFLKSEEVK